MAIHTKSKSFSNRSTIKPQKKLFFHYQFKSLLYFVGFLFVFYLLIFSRFQKMDIYIAFSVILHVYFLKFIPVESCFFHLLEQQFFVSGSAVEFALLFLKQRYLIDQMQVNVFMLIEKGVSPIILGIQAPVFLVVPVPLRLKKIEGCMKCFFRRSQ